MGIGSSRTILTCKEVILPVSVMAGLRCMDRAMGKLGFYHEDAQLFIIECREHPHRHPNAVRRRQDTSI